MVLAAQSSIRALLCKRAEKGKTVSVLVDNYATVFRLIMLLKLFYFVIILRGAVKATLVNITLYITRWQKVFGIKSRSS